MKDEPAMRSRRAESALSREQAALKVFEFTPTAEFARAWLVARERTERSRGAPDSEGRAERLARLSRDDAYCELVAASQRAVKAAADRRIFLIGYGTT